MAKSKSKGLGDSIEKIAKATGIEKAVKSVFGEDCGCSERKEVLNRLLPYKGNDKIGAYDVKRWSEFKNEYDQRTLYPYQQDLIIELTNKLGLSFSACRTCNASIWKRHIETIDDYIKNICDGEK